MLQQVEMEGLSGPLTFSRGNRADIEVDILQLKELGLQKVMTSFIYIKFY